MRTRSKWQFGGLVMLLTLGWCNPSAQAGSACVWKVTDAKGETLYLGGSIHALRSTDYPLPPAFNRAFDASERLAFESDEKPSPSAIKRILGAGKYPKNDSLKNHVDPRTYDYLQRVFALMHVPESKYASVHPWLLVVMLQSPEMHGLSSDLGVEGFLGRRAAATKKPITGLETLEEHFDVFRGLTDRQAEALLLLTFIPSSGTSAKADLVGSWRRGDADTIAREMRSNFSDFPAFGERILAARNRRWIPKIEGFLQSGRTYFVVAGAGHYGGPNGVLALLRARDYQIEQL